MEKEEFTKLKESLLEKGYKIWYQHLKHEDYTIGKGFHKEDNKWSENRSTYQIMLYIYDWSTSNEDFYNWLPDIVKERVGIDITIGVSRTTGERIDLEFAWHDDTTIEEIEAQAEGFYKWVLSTWPEPREID
jgi:hypothetical protein